MLVRKLLRAGALVCLAGLGACATIVNGRTQDVSVETSPLMPANCTLSNAVGTWYLQTPGTVPVHRSKTDLAIRCDGAGGAEGQAVIPPNFSAAGMGNVLVGGLVGVGVDAETGANFYYTSPIIVPMTVRQASN